MEAIIIDLVHHGLQGKSIKQAAKELNISAHAVRKHLRNARIKAPQLFPILTPTQTDILNLYTLDGATVPQIAAIRGVSEGTIREHLRKLRAKGVLHDAKPAKPCSFNEATMSDKVVRKW